MANKGSLSSPLTSKRDGGSDAAQKSNSDKQTKDSSRTREAVSNSVQIVHIHTPNDDFYAIQDSANSSRYKAVPKNLRDQLPPGAKTKAFDASKLSTEERKKRISVLKQVSVSASR